MHIRLLFFIFISCCSLIYAQNYTHKYQVSSLIFDYGGKSDDLPSLAPLLGVELSVDGQVFSANELTKNSKDIFLDLRGLQKVSQLPLQYLKTLGYEGLIAFPDPNQIDPISGKDLRPSSDRSLRIVIWVSRLQQVEFTNVGMKEGIFSQLRSLE